MSVVLYTGDTLPILEATVEDVADDGSSTVADLTDASAVLVLQREGSLATGSTKQMSIADPATDGLVQYEWTAADTAVAGSYKWAIRVTYADGSVRTYAGAPPIVIKQSLDS